MIDEEMLELTKRMVSIPSVNGTEGEKDDNSGTVILHGHTDTVGIEDFGAYEPYATD